MKPHELSLNLVTLISVMAHHPGVVETQMFRAAVSLVLIRKMVLFATLLSLATTFLWPRLFPFSLFATLELLGVCIMVHSSVRSQAKRPTLRVRPATPWLQFTLGTFAIAMVVAAAISVWASRSVSR